MLARQKASKVKVLQWRVAEAKEADELHQAASSYGFEVKSVADEEYEAKRKFLVGLLKSQMSSSSLEQEGHALSLAEVERRMSTLLALELTEERHRLFTKGLVISDSPSGIGRNKTNFAAESASRVLSLTT